MVAPTDAKLSKDIATVIQTIPAGWLMTFGALSAHFKTSPRHIATAVHSLADRVGAALPWHRVVADGGAVGRHAHRDEQIRRLLADGVAVSQGGFVQDFSRVVIANVAGPMPTAVPGAGVPRSRSRGMKDRPL